jgi:hypothetical protein
VFKKDISIQLKQVIIMLEWMLSVLVVIDNFVAIAFTTGIQIKSKSQLYRIP